MKKERTKQLFSMALYELSKTKKIDKIKVKDLCDYCGLSKKTFYNHFKDKYELAAYLYNSITSEELSDILSDDYFTELVNGNPILNVLNNDHSVEILQRMVHLWSYKNPKIPVNMSASDDINSLLSVLEQVHSEGRKHIILEKLKAAGKIPDNTDITLASEITYLIYLRYSEKWRSLYQKELPESEARRVIQLTNDIIDFWVSHAEDVPQPTVSD